MLQGIEAPSMLHSMHVILLHAGKTLHCAQQLSVVKQVSAAASAKQTNRPSPDWCYLPAVPMNKEHGTDLPTGVGCVLAGYCK